MKESRNWHPVRRWLRKLLLKFIERYLSVPTQPRKYRSLDPKHHHRARSLKRCIANKYIRRQIASTKND